MIYKQIAVRLPRLLDKDLNEVRRLRPTMQSISLNITPPSTASLTFEESCDVPMRAFVELFNAKGSAGIFRVNLPEEGFGSGDRLSLKHGVCVLEDGIARGKGKITGTPRSVFEQILANQTISARGQHMWKLGAVEAPESMTITVEHDGTKTLEMLARAISELEGYTLSFSQADFPWTVHVLRKKTEASCEGRLSRNIRTIRKTIDDSDLCTKLYCSLLEGGYIESDTVGAWGVVEREITLDDDMPKPDAAAYCQRYLENRKNPVVAIELDADEWYAMTGEKLDRFEIGDICRLALPEYGVTIEERIVAMNYMDALGRPESVTVSIANQVQDMSIKTAEMEKKLNDLKNKSTGYGNQFKTVNTTIANLQKEDEGIKEVNDKMVAWFAKAEINLDATEEGASVGILARYEEVNDLFSDVDNRVSEAELILNGGPDGATAGLVARVTENEKEIASAAVILNGTKDNPSAGLVAKVGANEAAITATASALGSRIDLKADTTYVQDLVANEISAAIEEIKLSITETIVADYITVKERATINKLALGGKNVNEEKVKVIDSISGLTTKEVELLTTETGETETASFYQRGALFQGTAYDTVETREFKLRGDAVNTVLYTTARVSVTKQGNPYPRELYYKSSSGAYLAVGETVYYAGSSADYYTRSKYADVGELYKSGGNELVTVGVTEHTEPLYQPGTKVSITTKEVTALTASIGEQ